MSLKAFQQAVVDLTLSYMKVRALRDGDDHGMLAGYDLTPLERERLLAIVRQRGIAVHCSLSRGNRLEVVVNAFPMTCVLLESRLRPLMNELWGDHQPGNYQLAGEEVAFAAFISDQIASSALTVEYLPEILAYEQTCLDLTNHSWLETSPAVSAERLVEFQHAPDDLLPPLARLTAPPPGLPIGSYPSRVTLRNKRFEVSAR
jgi:hypothetical protein